MKKVYISLVAGGVVALFANCANNNNGNNAPAAMAATCAYQQSATTNSFTTTPQMAGTLCNYNYSAITGFTSRSNTFVSGGFGSGLTNNCSYQQDAVYSPTKGLGCVSTTSLVLNGQPAIYDISQVTAAYTVVSVANPAFVQYAQQIAANPYLQQTGGYGSGGYGSSGYGSSSAFSSLLQTSGSQVLRVCDPTEPCPGGLTCRSPFGPASVPPIGICYY